MMERLQEKMETSEERQQSVKWEREALQISQGASVVKLSPVGN